MFSFGRLHRRSFEHSLGSRFPASWKEGQADNKDRAASHGLGDVLPPVVLHAAAPAASRSLLRWPVGEQANYVL